MATVSNSRLDTFVKCPQLYNLKYVRKQSNSTSNKRPITEALIKGSLTHNCIENYLKGGLEKDDAVAVAVAEWVRDTICLPVGKDADDYKNGLGINLEELTEYASKFGFMLQRFLPSYHAEDKIRTQKGEIIKDPIGYSFKYKCKEIVSAYNSLNLGAIKSRVDIQTIRVNHYFRHLSICDIAAEAVSWFYAFEVPKEVERVLAVEMKLDYDKVFLGNLYWNGAIDTIYETYDGAIVINDHKSEKDQRRKEDVAHDVQLNTYAAIRSEQTGHLPDYLAITHLRSGEFITAETDPTIVNSVVDYLQEIQAEIDNNIERHGENENWLRRWPGKYGSPCFKRHWQAGYLEEVCPYLKDCHPLYYESIKAEVDEYFGACVDNKVEVHDLGELEW